MAKNTISITRKQLMDKLRTETPRGFIFCELCGSQKTPEGDAVCAQCSAAIPAKKAEVK